MEEYRWSIPVIRRVNESPLALETESKEMEMGIAVEIAIEIAKNAGARTATQH